MKLSKHSGPIAFIDLLFNAQLVLTTSFHGTALSIVAQKKFWFLDSELHDIEDDRVPTVLNMFNLNQRMINGNDLLKKENILEDLDLNNINIILQKKKRVTIFFAKCA